MTGDERLDVTIREAARHAARVGPCIADERLVDFYHGGMDEAEADAVRAHLATCSGCVERARDAAEFVEAMAGSRAAATRNLRTMRPLAVAAALAGIALLVGTIYVAGRKGATSSPSGSAAFGSIPVVPAPYESEGGGLVWRGEGDPGSSAPLDVAAARYRRGDYAGAVEDLSAYVEVHSEDARGWFYLGVARLLSGTAVLAVADLEKARATRGSPPDASWYLALACLRAERIPRARAVLEEVAASAGPHRDEARALLGRLGPAGPP